MLQYGVYACRYGTAPGATTAALTSAGPARVTVNTTGNTASATGRSRTRGRTTRPPAKSTSPCSTVEFLRAQGSQPGVSV